MSAGKRRLLLGAIALVCGLAMPGERAMAQSDPVRFGNALAAPPSAPEAANDRAIKVIEADGSGSTELEARKAAVGNAVEQAVGVFIDSRRRSEMKMTDDQLHQVIEEKIVTFSSAFVERMQPISANSDGQGGYTVRLRAYVAVPQLLDAMKEADLPAVPVDAISNQTKFATQAQMQENASDLAASSLQALPSVIRAEVDPSSVKATLDPNDSSLAALEGGLLISIDPGSLAHFKQIYEALKSRHAGGTFVNPPGYMTQEEPPLGAGLTKPLSFYVCLSNVLGQVDCHGEDVARDQVLRSFGGVDLVFELLAGQQSVGKVSARLMLGCIVPGSTDVVPGYLEAPLRGLGNYDPMFGPMMSITLLWASVKNDFRTSPIAVRVTARPVPDTKATGTSVVSRTIGARGYAPTGPHGICLQMTSYDTLRVIVPNSPAPIRREFYLMGPRAILERVDGIRVSIGPAAQR